MDLFLTKHTSSVYIRGKKITCPGARDKLNFRHDKHIFSPNIQQASKKFSASLFFLEYLVSDNTFRTSYFATGRAKILEYLPGVQVKFFRYFNPCIYLWFQPLSWEPSFPILPCTPVLSRKLPSWNVQLFDARYCVNLCTKKAKQSIVNFYSSYEYLNMWKHILFVWRQEKPSIYTDICNVSWCK